MRYDTMIYLYGQLDAIYTGITMGLLLLLAVGFMASLTPLRWRPFARGGVLAMALLEYISLLLFVTLGGAIK